MKSEMKRLKTTAVFLGFTLFIILSGCNVLPGLQPRPSPETVQQTIQAIATLYTPIVPTLTPSVMVTVSPSSTSTPEPTATLQEVQCSENRGEIEYREIVTSGSSHPLAFRVYLPPCYDQQPHIHYPVLYLFHRQAENDAQWDRLGADEIADQLISSGDAPPFIMVMPWEANSLEDAAESRYGEIIIESLISWIDREYRTCTSRECRSVGGISRGGGWAIRLGLTHWELFSSIGAHSYAPFPGDFYNAPFWFRDIPEGQFPRIYMDMGASDDMMEPAGLFEERLTKYSIAHEWIINRGTHNEIYWQEHIEDYLYWYTFPWRKLYAGPDTGFITPTVVNTPSGEEIEDEKTD